LLPRLLPELVGVGEETGSLAAMLGKIGEILEEESRRTIDRLLALLTPAVTLAMGLVVAGVLAALFSAILSINELAL
jgi:general secretion pathway protein F